MSHLSDKAIDCTAHLLMWQNPRAYFIKGTDDWLLYKRLVRDWCEQFTVKGVAIYWHVGFDPEEIKTGRLN